MTAESATDIELIVRDGVLQVRGPQTRWLSSGWNGGFHTTDTVMRSALPGLLATAIEAKAATLLTATGFAGTTTDAAIVGATCGDSGDSSAGPATTVGADTRVCVRDAVLAALEARNQPTPDSVKQADAGVVTDRSTAVLAPTDRQ